MRTSLQFLFILLSYLIGSISFAVLISKIMSLPSPYDHGSGNPGTTNVLRTGNKTAACLTFIGDFLKGYVVVVLSRFFITDSSNNWILSFVIFSTLFGHIFPIFHNFKGGKGVAVTLGILWSIHWLFGSITLLIWLIVFLLTKYASIASLSAAICIPIFFILLFDAQEKIVITLILMSILLIWMHRSNIVALYSNKERRIRLNLLKRYKKKDKS